MSQSGLQIDNSANSFSNANIFWLHYIASQDLSISSILTKKRQIVLVKSFEPLKCAAYLSIFFFIDKNFLDWTSFTLKQFHHTVCRLAEQETHESRINDSIDY